MADTTAVYTTIKNTSGGDLVASFIPPHGKKLAADEDVTVFGDIWDQLSKGGRHCKRLQASFEAALLSGDIEVISSPNVFLYDTTRSHVKMLAVSDNVLGIADPSWGSYTGDG